MERYHEIFEDKACGAFEPMPTNKDVCTYWMVYGDDEYCRKSLWCATSGLRPERLDQESDSEE